MHYYITELILALDIKELGINTTGSFSWNNGVQNINIRIIVFINWNGTVPGKPKFLKHRTQKPSSLVSSYSSNQICFCGTQSIYRFSFRPLNNFTSRKYIIKSSSESPLVRISYVCSIHKTHQFYFINLLLGFEGISFPTIIWNLGSGRSSQGPLQF